MNRTQFENDYYAALAKCAVRYEEMLMDYVYRHPMKAFLNSEVRALIKFIPEYKQSVEDRLPLMKMNRWLGYIQRDLILMRCTTVQTERDWTRPLFRPLDFADIE